MNQLRIDPSLLQMEIKALSDRDIRHYAERFGDDVSQWLETYNIPDPHRPSAVTVGVRLKRL